uniref:Transposase, Ptta/En/Spm, plant n=1 Tax=Oryza punctata TaxID=4537 RepID=A0A0E0KP07_ORYPU
MTHEQWQAIEKMWSDPKHKEKCPKNKLNRENVRYQQRIGSRCYIAHCHVVKQTKYKDVSATAIDLFKECHRSRKNGFSEPVKNIIADMEAIIDDLVQDGEEPKTHTEVISQVMPKSKFLQNTGLESATPKRNGKAIVAARVQELQTELEAERQDAANLRDKLDVSNMSWIP